MLINHQDMKVNPTVNARFPSPVVGSVDDNIAVSANVHLYADPHTISMETPVLYADCEGLEGGESAPKAEAFKSRENSLERYSLRGSFSEVSTRKYERHHRKGRGAPRKIAWALGDKERSQREYAVTELYPRVLYTFSDVVVFVLRNPK